MPDQSAFDVPPPNQPKNPADSGRKCRKCGYNLTGLLEPVRCPECGREHGQLDAEWDRKDKTHKRWLIIINAAAVAVGVWGFLSPTVKGDFWPWGTGPGFDLFRACFILPTQGFIGLCAFCMCLAWLWRADDPARIPHWLVIGTAVPFLLAIPTCLKS